MSTRATRTGHGGHGGHGGRWRSGVGRYGPLVRVLPRVLPELVLIGIKSDSTRHSAELRVTRFGWKVFEVTNIFARLTRHPVSRSPQEMAMDPPVDGGKLDDRASGP